MEVKEYNVPGIKGTVKYFTLTNKNGATVVLSSYGAGIVKIIVPDKDGNMADVIIGYDDPAAYINDGPCAGKTPGRYANRICDGHLHIKRKGYKLVANNGPNHLHGGNFGFQNQNWAAEADGENKVVMTHVSPGNNANYPAELKATVTYEWTDDNELKINYKATASGLTVVNLTNHAYFNMDGFEAGKDTPELAVANHTLWLNAEEYLPTDETLIPLRNVPAPVEPCMDFTTEHKIGDYLRAEEYLPIKIGKGYDHCYCVKDWDVKETKLVARLKGESGRTLEVYTNQPGAQVYTGGWLEGCPQGKDGVTYHDFCAVAIECQGYPDAPNRPDFPKQVIGKGETYDRSITYKFSN